MKRLEDELKSALQREAPPDGFTARVLARVAEREHRRQQRRPWFALPVLRWAAAAIIVVAAAGGGFEHYRELQRRREGELAKQQVILALRITSEKLQQVQWKVRQLNRDREAREQ